MWKSNESSAGSYLLLMIPSVWGQVDFRPHSQCQQRTAELAHLLRHALMSQRHSPLTQITPANVKNLELQWVFQAHSLEKFEATPLVVDGVLYTVQAPNDVVAIDADTGRVFWVYRYAPSPEARVCCGRVNRGLAILGDTLFMGTIDGHLLALDSKTGQAHLERYRRQSRGGLLVDARAAGGQRQSDRRRRRR